MQWLFTNIYIAWVPKVFYPLAFIAAVIFYFLDKEKRAKRFMRLAVGVVLFRVAYALFETVGQYYVWSQNSFTRLFLPPHQSISYLFVYSGDHYWLNGVFAVSCAVLFALFLKALRRHNKRYFDDGEVELGAAVALIVGWPGFISFLLIVFPSVILVSVIRRIFFGELYTTLGEPFLVATLILFIWGDAIMDFLHLTMLSFPRPM
jgi:hypothetical protein